MARIRIKDLPKDMKISKEELKRIRGGALTPLLSLGGTGQISIPPDPLDYGKITYPSTGSLNYGKIEIEGGTVGWDPGETIR